MESKDDISSHIFTYVIILKSSHWDLKMCHNFSLDKNSEKKVGVCMCSADVKVMINQPSPIKVNLLFNS